MSNIWGVLKKVNYFYLIKVKFWLFIQWNYDKIFWVINMDEYKITYNLIGTTVTKLGEEMREGE